MPCSSCLEVARDQWYQRCQTFHSHDYYTTPWPDETGPCGGHDNSCCKNPQAVVDVMAKVGEPWIAFNILAAGTTPPRAAFPYAFNSGTDFILVGMLDWQGAENASLAQRVVDILLGAESKRAPLVWLKRWYWLRRRVWHIQSSCSCDSGTV